MIKRSTRVKIAAFVTLGLVGTSYLGLKYAGLDSFGAGYEVSVSLPDAGGLFVNGEVTYHGVPVGEVSSLTATGSGVQARIRIDGDAPAIPADVTAAVANRSVIGEQYLDLRSPGVSGASGTSGTGAGSAAGSSELRDGDRLTVADDALPPDIARLLRSGRDFTASVPADALDTVIDETYELARGSSGDLRRLVETSLSFQQAADRNFLTSASLIRNSEAVLRTQEASADSLRAYSRDLGVLANTLRDSDGDLRALIANSPAAARQIGALIDDVGRPLGTLMGNLVTTAQVFGTHSAGVEDTMIRLPEAISIGWAITGSRGTNLGLVPSFFDPLPCVSGYGGTPLRPGTDTSDGAPLNTRAGCTLPPSSGVGVRGPGAVPAAKPAARLDVADSLGDLLGGDE